MRISLLLPKTKHQSIAIYRSESIIDKFFPERIKHFHARRRKKSLKESIILSGKRRQIMLQSRKFTHPVCSRCNPLLLYEQARYISDDFVLFSRGGSAHSTEFQDIDSVTRASLRAPLSRVRKRSTKLIAALPLAFETRKSANSSAVRTVIQDALVHLSLFFFSRLWMFWWVSALHVSFFFQYHEKF